MTASKKFKARVRARSAKTGEAYTVARRRLLETAPDSATSAATSAAMAPGAYRLRGGLHPPTCTLANVLAHHGLTLPGSAEPVSEAFVLGVSGGLGAGYILWQWQEHERRVVTTGFLNNWQYPGRWVRSACERLGVTATVHETGGTRAAATALAEALDAGRPAIADVSVVELRYWNMPTVESGWWGYPVVVYGRDGDAFLVDDRNLAALHVTSADLAAARSRIGSWKNRLVVVEPSRPDEGRLMSGVYGGLAEQVAHLSAKSDSFSLPAWRKWARMTSDTRNSKGWPTVFADGLATGSLRASIYTEAAHGAHLRGLYADFLDEAAGLLGRESLTEAADAWRRAAARWEPIVDTALPPGDELRELIDRGDSARWDLQRERDRNPGDLPDVGEPVAAMYEAETSALRMLGSAVS